MEITRTVAALASPDGDTVTVRLVTRDEDGRDVHHLFEEAMVAGDTRLFVTTTELFVSDDNLQVSSFSYQHLTGLLRDGYQVVGS